MTFLSNDEREKLRSQHKKERDKRICDRIKAVLLYDEGWTLMQISHVLLLSDDAIRKHIKEYKDLKKLKKLTTPVSIGDKMYFASQTIAVVNNELDWRGL